MTALMAGNIFVIADLHLSFGVDKPMDIFGKAWQNHTERLEENWRRYVDDKDLVIVAGDLSWGLKEHEALPDLEFIDKLPGKKILMKGNHELWWTSLTRLKHLRDAKGLSTLNFLHNNAFYITDYDITVCGTRGWKCPGCESGFDSNDLKIYNRELNRLKLSVDYGKKLRHAYLDALEKGTELPLESMGVITLDEDNTEKKKFSSTITCFHYPPFAVKGQDSGFTELMRDEGVDTCFFGHLHGIGRAKKDEKGFVKSFAVSEKGVKCYLVSADFTELCPLRIDFDGEGGIITPMGVEQ
jgi:predicted phosphohydrolase